MPCKCHKPTQVSIIINALSFAIDYIKKIFVGRNNMNKVKKWLLNRLIGKINSLCGELSVGGFPEEALKIRQVLHSIRRKDGKLL